MFQHSILSEWRDLGLELVLLMLLGITESVRAASTSFCYVSVAVDSREAHCFPDPLTKL